MTVCGERSNVLCGQIKDTGGRKKVGLSVRVLQAL